MASRPKHVSTLSDKISGLKFMQRAKAVQEKSQPSSSQVVQPKILESNEKENNHAEVSEQKDANEEHWVLPGSALKPIKRLPSSSSIVSHEPGWNAWLIEAAEDGGASKGGIEEEEAAAAGVTTTKRRLFGSWLNKGKKRKERGVDKEEEEDQDFDEEGSEESGEEVSDDEKDQPKQKEKGSVGGKLKGFIKPGTYKESKSDKFKRKDIEQSDRDKVRDTASRDVREKGSKERSDKRKRQSVKKGSRGEVLKGFPDQGRPLKKMKKKKSPST